MKRIFLIFLIFIILISGCGTDQQREKNIENTKQITFKKVVLEPNFKGKMGQTIYVPIYSHIYYENCKS